MEPAAAGAGEDPTEAADHEKEERVIGTWTYRGRSGGSTRYSVRRTRDGRLIFEGPDGQGSRLSGTLRPSGDWLFAQLARRGGAAAGAIRLAPVEGRPAVVSNFRGEGKVKWGKDIVAQRVDETLPSAGSRDKGKGPFTAYAGCISRGGDLLVADMTIGEAKAWCHSLQRCQGFCFKGSAEDDDVVVRVYFKSKWDLVVSPSDGNTWTSFRYEDAKDPQAEPEAEAPEQPLEEPGDDLNVIPGKRCFWDWQTVSQPDSPNPRLNDVAVQMFRENGFIGPMRALRVEEIRECQEGLERFVSGHCQGILDNASTLLNHVTLPWLYNLACHPRIVGAVASALETEDVLLFSSCMFLRSPGLSCKQELGVGWHQDGVLYDKVLEPMEDWITAFVAITPCRMANGCLQYCPRRMVRCSSTDDRKFPHMELGPGEFSLHSSKVVHRAGVNSTAWRRDCLALRYISGRVRDTWADRSSNALRDWAILCTGQSTGCIAYEDGRIPALKTLPRAHMM